MASDLLAFTFASVADNSGRACGCSGCNTSLEIGGGNKVMKGVVFGIVESEGRLVGTCSCHNTSSHPIVIVVISTLGTKVSAISCGRGMVFGLTVWGRGGVSAGCGIGFVSWLVRRTIRGFISWSVCGLLCEGMVVVDVVSMIMVLIHSVVMVDSVGGVMVLDNDLRGNIRSWRGHGQSQSVSFHHLGNVAQTLEFVAFVVRVLFGVFGFVSCLWDLVGVRHVVRVRCSVVHGFLVVFGVRCRNQMMLQDAGIRGVGVLDGFVVGKLGVGSVGMLDQMVGVDLVVRGVRVRDRAVRGYTMGGSVRMVRSFMVSNPVISRVRCGHRVVVHDLVVRGVRVRDRVVGDHLVVSGVGSGYSVMLNDLMVGGVGVADNVVLHDVVVLSRRRRIRWNRVGVVDHRSAAVGGAVLRG